MKLLRSALFLYLIAGLHSVALEVTTTFAAENQTVSDILKQEQAIIEQRRRISSGHVAVRRWLRVFAQDPSQVDRVTHGRIWFRDRRIRVDWENGAAASQTVFTPRTLIRRNDDIVDVLGISLTERIPQECPHPLFLGLSVWFFDSMNAKGYEEVLLNPNRAEFTTEGSLDTTLAVTFRLRDGDTVGRGEYLLSSHAYGMPTFMALRFGDADNEYVRSLSTQYGQFGGMPYVRESVFRITRRGVVTAEEIVEVIEAQFDVEVPDACFSLAGLGVPTGASVNYHGKVGIWNGDEVVSRHVAPLLTRARNSRRFVVFMAFLSSAVLCGLVAVVLGYIRRVRR